MKKIEMYLSIGFPTAKHRVTMEIPEDYTDEDIQTVLNDWAWDYIDYGWNEVGEDE